ncbi:MAG: M48 family metallopeptidase, partial [Planctomycetota bacterium]
APNAFATGRNPKHAKVAITRGLLTKLKRDELQGVMAHELSHIQNRDILFAMMIGVLVGMIVLLCDAFMLSMWFGGGRRRRRGRGGGAEAIIMIAGILLAILAPILARIIQFAVSRQREYLADASAAKLTRYPEGLARALEKISGDREVLEVANRATQHLYIVNPIKAFEKRAQSVFNTHPPIQERINRLRAMQ